MRNHPFPSIFALVFSGFPRLHRRGLIEAHAATVSWAALPMFPRLHRRGRIEALPPKGRPHDEAGFHGFTAVAELKRHESSPAPLPPCRFHGFTAVAELKRDARRLRGMARAGFHGFTAVAELKRRNLRGSRKFRTVFPRLHRRGRIEAWRRWYGCCSACFSQENRHAQSEHGSTHGSPRPRSPALDSGWGNVSKNP